MKRDPNLIRAIVLRTELVDPANTDIPAIDGFTRDQIGEHIRLAMEAGLLEAMDLRDMQSPYDWAPRRLTNLGHDFADAVRADSAWKRVLDAVGPRAESIATGVLTALISATLKNA